MKKLSLLLMAVVFAVVNSIAQTKITEGIMKMKMDIISMPNMENVPEDQMEMVKTMFKDANMTVFFKGDKSKVIMDMVMAKTTIISDKKANTAVSLTDAMGAKYRINVPLDDKKEEAKKEKYTIEKGSETKTIAGYNCKKATVKTQDGKIMEVFYTNDIEVDYEQKDAGYVKELGGVPMEFEMENEGIKMRMTVTTLKSETVADSHFVIPEGYTEMTLEQLQNMGGGKN